MAVELPVVAAVLAGSMTPTGRRWLRAAGKRVAELRSLARDAFAHPYHHLRVKENTSVPLAAYAATCLAGEEAEPKRCCTVLRGEVLLLGPAIDRLEPMLSLGGAEVTMEDARVSIAGRQAPPKVELEFDSEEEAQTWWTGLRQAACTYPAPPRRLLSLVEHLVAQEMHNADLAAPASKTKERCERLESKLKSIVAQDKENEEMLKSKLEKAQQAVKLVRSRSKGVCAVDEEGSVLQGQPLDSLPAVPAQGGKLPDHLDILDSQRSEIGDPMQGLLKDPLQRDEAMEEVAGVREQLNSLTNQLSEVASMRRPTGSGVSLASQGDDLTRRGSLQSIAEGSPTQELLAVVEGQLREATERISALKEWNEKLQAQVWRYEHQSETELVLRVPQADTGSASFQSSANVEQELLVAQMQGLMDEKAEELVRERQLHLRVLQEVQEGHANDVALMQQAAEARMEQLQVSVRVEAEQAMESERRSHRRELKALRELREQEVSSNEEERARLVERCGDYERQLEEACRAREEHAAELARRVSEQDEELREIRQGHRVELDRASRREEELRSAHRDHVAATLQEQEEELLLAHRGLTSELEAALREQEDVLLVRQGRIKELEAAAQLSYEADFTRASQVTDLEVTCEAQQARIQELEATCRLGDKELLALHRTVVERDELLAQLSEDSDGLEQLAQLRQLCTVREERIRKLEEEHREKEGQILQMQGEVVRKSQELERMALKISSPRTRMVPSPENDPKNIVSATFEPGSLGLSFEVEGGLVVEVDELGQANQNGVRPGWVIHLVDEVPYAAELFEQRMAGCLPYALSFKTMARVPAFEKATLVRQVQKLRLDMEILRQPQTDPDGGEPHGEAPVLQRALHAEAQLEQLMAASREERGAMQEALARLESQHASAQQRAEQAEREMHAAAAREAAQRQERDAGLRKLSAVEERLARMEVEVLQNRSKLEASQELGDGFGFQQPKEGLPMSPARKYVHGSRTHAVAGTPVQPPPASPHAASPGAASTPGSLSKQPLAGSPTNSSILVDVQGKVAEAKVFWPRGDYPQAQVLGTAVLSDSASGMPLAEVLSPPAPGGRVVASPQPPLAWPLPGALLPLQAMGVGEPAGSSTAAPSPASCSDSASTPQASYAMMQRRLSNSRIMTLPPQMATTATGRMSPVMPAQSLWSPPEPRPGSEPAAEATSVPLQPAAKASLSSQPAQALLQQPQPRPWSSMPGTASPRGPAIQPQLLPSTPQRMQTSVRWIQPGVAQWPHEQPVPSVQTVVQTAGGCAAAAGRPADGLTTHSIPRRGSWASGSNPQRSSFPGTQILSRSMMPPRSNTEGTEVLSRGMMPPRSNTEGAIVS